MEKERVVGSAFRTGTGEELRAPGDRPVEVLVPAASWQSWSPRSALRPDFLTGQDGTALGLAGAGNEHAFGWWTREVPIDAGATYRIRARLSVSGIDDPSLHVLTAVAWRRGSEPLAACPQDYLQTYHRVDGGVVAEGTLQAPADARTAQLLLILRFSPHGTVWWDSLTLQRVPAASTRPVRVAVVHGPAAESDGPDNRAGWAALLDDVPDGMDLVCLPECMNAPHDTVIADVAEPLFGPTYELLSGAARRLGAYVCGCYYERDGDLIFNTAVMIDREGHHVGHYRKVHPYWPELHKGVSPGSELPPVFSLDFGAVGLMTCYDSWFVETARVLALQGAEIVVFPNEGHEPRIMPARAIDNNLYLVSASLDSPAGIIDTLGAPVVETRERGVVSATVDLAHRPTPHPNAGGLLNASPGGRRAMRHAASDRLLQEVVSQHARWDGDDVHT